MPPARRRIALALGLRGESGASLILALAFLVAIGVMISALLGYAEVAAKSQKRFREQRDLRYAADGAIEDGIKWAAGQPLVGRDDGVQNCALNVPAQGTNPAMLVTCAPEAGSGSGLPNEVGSVPEYSLLTLGQRHTEPPPYNGSLACLWETGNKGWDPLGLRGSNRAEYGIRMSKTTTVCIATRQVNSWDVKGKVFSNSPILVNPGGTMLLADGTSSVRARGGCTNVASGVCANAGLTVGDPMQPGDNLAEGQDPRTDSTATAAERATWNLPDLSGLTKRSVPSASECATKQVITFEPGWYQDAAGLNALFNNSTCRNKTFWFAPARGSDGNLLGTGYKQGLYYFDFTNNYTGGCNWYDASEPETRHLWCIGQTYDSNQKVIGGTPKGWSPFATNTGTPTVPIDTAQVDTWGTTFWSNRNNASKIDGTVASYTNPILAIDRPITLHNWTPKVAQGTYNTSFFNILVAHNTPSSFNTPTITVSYDSSLFGSRTCGTFTLTGGTGNHLGAGNYGQLNSTDQGRLARCLNDGDKINTVKVRYNVSGCNFFCFGNTPQLDGMRLVPDSYPDQPAFPDSSACDPTKPGVSFIFGGDSHVYVADGAMELCAGPAAQNTIDSQQIAFYGVPAVEPVRPTNVTQNNGGNTTGSANRDNAKRIAEQTVDRGATATVSYGRSNCGFCAETIRGGLNLSYAGMKTWNGTTMATGIPNGLQIRSIRARASYNSHGIITGPELSLPCGQTFGFSPSHGIPQIDGNTQQTIDVTNCMRNYIGGSFTATWWARGLVVCAFGICGPRNYTDDLDGVEFIVDLEATNPGASSGPVPVPARGCIYSAPNFWGADQGGDGTCPIIQADQTKNPLNSSQNSVGRFSAKGTVYVPSGAVSIDDEDVNYPFFQRGLVARTLMFRGFRYRNRVPIVEIPSIDKSQRPRQVLFQACTRPGLTTTDTRPCGTVSGDVVLSRALVRYENDLSPSVDITKRATVPKVQWWSLSR